MHSDIESKTEYSTALVPYSYHFLGFDASAPKELLLRSLLYPFLNRYILQQL